MNPAHPITTLGGLGGDYTELMSEALRPHLSYMKSGVTKTSQADGTSRFLRSPPLSNGYGTALSN